MSALSPVSLLLMQGFLRAGVSGMPVVSMGSVKSAGTSTLALTIAGAAAAANIPVLMIDAANDWDLVTWSSKPGRPEAITVARCEQPGKLADLVADGLNRGALVLIDAGTKPETLRLSARLADVVLLPVRFSPLSSYAAAATDIFLAAETRGMEKRRAFIATCIAQIPSRIARAVEERLAKRNTERLPTGLAQRAAFEAPFLFGGTVFTLKDAQAPGLARAQEDAAALAIELGILRHARPDFLNPPVRVPANGPMAGEFMVA